MTNLTQTLQKTAEIECSRGGFKGVVNMKEFSEKPHFQAHTSMETQETTIKQNPQYKGNSQRVIKDIARHEINHHRYKGFRGCPRNLDNHVLLFYKPMEQVLQEKGFSSQDVHYATNALEDSILHCDLGDRFSLDGISDFLKDSGESAETKKFTDFYEAHVRLNLFLWGNKQKKKALKRYFKNSQKMRKVLQNFLKRTGLDELKRQSSRNREKLRDYLNDKSNWPEISRIYAEEFSELMTPNYAMPLLNHSGAGTKARESEPSDGEGNEFDKQMNSKTYKEQRTKKSYKAGDSLPEWMDSFESLDMLYQSFARKLNIKVEPFTRQEQMPIYWFGKRAFNPEKDNFKHIGFGFDDKGRVELKKKTLHGDIPLQVKINQRGFPTARYVLLDSSGSMFCSPEGNENIGKTSVIPWGDNSRYHYSLLAWYGFLEYLKQNHLLKQTGIELANFSSTTTLGRGLKQAKKTALTPKKGGTRLDISKTQEMFSGRGSLIFSISDGDIGNWSSIRNSFIENAKKHYYFHLQIGDETPMTNDLDSSGIYVVPIKNARDLSTKTIDLTDRVLRGGL